MKLFESRHDPGTIFVGEHENSAVLIAADNLTKDIESVCHVRPQLVHQMDDRVVIVIGTAAQLPAAPIYMEKLWDDAGKLRWEAYLQQAAQGRLWLVGSDRRGAVYAVYDFCEQIGVSPWYDMADVPVRQRNVISVPDTYLKADWPSIQYRGIFLNDEEELDAWARRHTADGTIGPDAYEKIFELILRLKGNFIWPAMHVNAFNMNPENGKLADRMGIVTGTSHCDMLHRSNQNEWKPWVESKGYDGLQYDYTIPGENRERLLEYWRESLRQNGGFECCYTIGMRGIHDSGFVTGGLDVSASPEEQLRQKRELLEEIMRVQRRLIAEELPGREVPQTFVPYKEVLPIYDSGLQVPEDVTLIWVDDNHGYMRRYPNAREQQRSGGNGLYYHSSYWAPPGMSWLFICSTPLAHMGNELKKCYEQNIRRIWVDNVGALKPIEQDMEYFLRCGWDAGRPDSVMLDARRFIREWIDRNFSGRHGEEAAALYSEFTQLCNLCKPEHMRADVFSQTAYGDEAGARVWRMYELAQQAEAIWRSLPEEERDAFFQLFLMKIQAAFYIAASYYYADRSRAAYDLGAMRAAEDNTVKSRAMDDLKRLLLHYYNEVVSHGRWSGILTPEAFPPPGLELYPACRPALRIGEAALVVRLPECGMPGSLTVSAECPETWVELFNAGAGSLDIRLEADEGITLSADRVRLESEARVAVRAERSGALRIHTQGTTRTVPVFRAADAGYVHIRAEDALEVRGFTAVAGLGRGVGAAMEAGAGTDEQHPASLTVPFTLHQAGSCELELIRFLTLRSTGSIRLRVTVDDVWRRMIASETTDEWLGNWAEAAMHNGEKLRLRLPELSAGTHTLTVEALDPYITLDCVNLYTRTRVPSMLGPGCLPPRREIPRFDVTALSAMYGLRTENVPLPKVVYAGDRFWKQDMLYARNEERQPQKRGHQTILPRADGTKDVIAQLNPRLVEEHGGCLAWEAENALCQSENAWTTPGGDGLVWSHRQAETGGRTGLAMCIDPGEVNYRPAQPGPRLHYRIRCLHSAVYRLWLLMKYDDARGFRVRFLLDGAPMRDTAEQCRECFHTYRTVYVWCWQKLASVPLTAGEHILSIEADGTGMAIDRLYLTTGDEEPPMDEAWR